MGGVLRFLANGDVGRRTSHILRQIKGSVCCHVMLWKCFCLTSKLRGKKECIPRIFGNPVLILANL